MTEHAGFLLLQAAPGGPGQSPLGMLVPFAAIFVIFYFLLIRPQQKRQKEQEAMLKGVEKGDRVRFKLDRGRVDRVVAKAGADKKPKGDGE